MKVALCSPLLLLLTSAQAFTPAHLASSFARSQRTLWSRTTTARHLAVDPSSFQDSFHALQDALTSFTLLADAADVASDAVESVANAASDAVTATTDAAAVAVDPSASNGWFGFLTGPIESLLKVLHVGVAVVMGSNSWGVSIVILTLLIKALTYPLTKSQLESTTKMQAMQPEIKKIQAKYQSNPEVMNQKVAEFYQANEINPLAGCIPSLVQIPVFIGLYRAVLTLAKEDKLDEPFLFLPSLEGPTYGADPTHGSDWILKGWTDGVPSLGWDHTIAFLILPIALVVSQFISMELMQPKTPEGQAQQNNVVLKLLPLMIGWFSLNVPSALCVYWVTNNIVTTATSLYIRNTLQVDAVVTPSASASATSSATMEPPSIFAPPREKPSGFGSPAPSSLSSKDDVKPITAIDAEIVKEKETASSSSSAVSEESLAESEASTEAAKKRGRKKRKKKT